MGLHPMAKACWAAKERVADPVGVVLSSTETVLSPGLSPRLATTRSTLPSPLTSAVARETGFGAVAKVCGVEKEKLLAPIGVVFRSTDTESKTDVMTRSGLPSPL